MNSLTGKSTGIALLLAAGLLAALFAMGVFSASGVGAQEEGAGPTATAELIDPAVLTEVTTDTPTDTKSDDTLRITFEGLAEIGFSDDNQIVITMDQALSNSATFTWGEGQPADSGNIVAYSSGTYAFALADPARIAPGTATLDIAGTNSVHENTAITSITVGRGTGATQNTITNVPLSIGNAPAGPSITIDPPDGLIGADDYVVTLTGEDFPSDDDSVTLSRDETRRR